MSQNALATDISLEIDTSRQLTAWLLEQNISLSFSTYQTGKLFLIGLKPDGKLSVFERTFERVMGLHASPERLYMSTLYQIWRMENVLGKNERQNGYDAIYVPQSSTITGDIDVHDMAVDKDGTLIFANTLFSCLASTSETHSFRPIWKPHFISKLAAEDRCHLNGLAMKDGMPAYVTAVGKTDVYEGWRDRRHNGGIVMDVAKNEIICEGFSMPHSPRWYQDRLWLHDSGNGAFGYVDLASGKFEQVCFCPGYLRGLAFHGNYAIAGISKPRGVKTFNGLPLDGKLAEQGVEARCGLLVIDLKRGDIVHSLTLSGIVQEIYDVVVLEGIRTPMAIGFKTDEIRRMISIEES